MEDEPSLQFFYKQVLEMNEFEISGIAENGEKAINMFKSFINKPEIILMDHRMPIKNGLDATKEILQLDKSIKIIFTSADDCIKEEALKIGAYSFMDKPFGVKDLITMINKAKESYPH
ncbi:MAG: response regulator [Promethearchaeota archaeon]